MDFELFRVCARAAAERLTRVQTQSSLAELLEAIAASDGALERRTKNAMFCALFDVGERRFALSALGAKNVFALLAELEGVAEFFDGVHSARGLGFQNAIANGGAVLAILNGENSPFESIYFALIFCAFSWIFYLILRIGEEKLSLICELFAFRPKNRELLGELCANAVDERAPNAEMIDCFDFYETEIAQIARNISTIFDKNATFSVSAISLFNENKSKLDFALKSIFFPFNAISVALTRRRAHAFLLLTFLWAFFEAPRAPPTVGFALSLFEELLRFDRQSLLGAAAPAFHCVRALNRLLRLDPPSEWRELLQRAFLALVAAEIRAATAAPLLDCLALSLLHAMLEPPYEQEALTLLSAVGQR